MATRKIKFSVKEPLRRPRTKREFAAMLYNLFGLTFPPVAVCKGHSAPLTVLWQIYNQEYPTAIIVAARKSGKTLGIASLQVLFALTYKFLRSCDVAATKKQASVCYEHSRDLLFYPQGKFGHLVTQYIVGEGTKEEITLATGSTIAITTGSLEGVNAIHPHKLFIDEVELGSWDVIQEAMLAPVSEGEIKRQIAFISSWKFRGGIVDKLLELYKNDAETLKAFWCSFEAMQPVHDCSFCYSLKRVLPDGRTVTFADFAHEDGECKARKARGFMSLSDVKRNFLELEEPVFRAQWLTQQPQGSGLSVFYFYDSSRLKNYTPIAGLPVVIGVDFGRISALIYAQVVPPGWIVVFNEEILYNLSPHEIAGHCLNRERELRAHGIPVEGWVIDPRSFYILQKEFANLGLNAVTPWTPTASYGTEKKNRVNIVNSFLVPSGDLGLPRLYVVESRAPALIKQLSEMTYKIGKDGLPTDELPDRDDHSADALLYVVSYIYGMDMHEEIGATARDMAHKVITTILDQIAPEQGEDPTKGELFELPSVENNHEAEIISAVQEYINAVTDSVVKKVAADAKIRANPTDIARQVLDESKEMLETWLNEHRDLLTQKQIAAIEDLVYNMPPEVERKLLEISVRNLDKAMMQPRIFTPTSNPIANLYEQVLMDTLALSDYPFTEWIEGLGGMGFPPVGGTTPPLPF